MSGCPPRPEALLQGLNLLQDSIGKKRRPVSWVINDQGVYEREKTTQQEVVHAITAGTLAHVPGMSSEVVA